jgi:hypothetical protein
MIRLVRLVFGLVSVVQGVVMVNEAPRRSFSEAWNSPSLTKEAVLRHTERWYEEARPRTVAKLEHSPFWS